MTKISELGRITGAATETGDLFVTVNLAQGDNGTKNITRAELVKGLEQEQFAAIQITGGTASNLNISQSPISNSTLTNNSIVNSNVSNTNITNSTISSTNFTNSNIATTVFASGTISNTTIETSNFLGGTISSNTAITQANISNSTIILKNSTTAGYVPAATDLQLAELFVNTNDGKIYYRRSKNATDTLREVGLKDKVSNVYYVAESGDDTNDGTTLAESFRTLDKALQVVTAVRNAQTDANYTRITIYVKSGDYNVTNPVNVPRNVSIIGDNLRNTTLRPVYNEKDLFYVNNGVYIAQFAFKGLAAPVGADLLANPELSPAVVSYNPDGSAGIITQSPYVQNCTSITTTGTGMRVDGKYAQGLRSMVLDAFTQYNQGGIGICMLNQGYTQLVSVFTIACEIGILCKNGGYCSITNSNSSFGVYGLVADGVSETLYSGKLVTQVTTNSFQIKNLKQKPRIGDAIKFASQTGYLTVAGATDLVIDTYNKTTPDFATIQPLTSYVNARNIILPNISTIQVDTIAYLNKQFPSFVFNQDLCSRDVATIINSVIDDMVLETNYRSILAGGAYYRATAAAVINFQSTETVAAINFVRDSVLNILINNGYSIISDEYIRLENNFNTVTAIIQNGTTGEVINFDAANTSLVIPSSRINAKNILQLNKEFYVAEGIAYIEANRPQPTFTYDKAKCARDVGYIIDAVAYDLMLGSTTRSISAGRAYRRGTSSNVIVNEIVETVSAIRYIQTLVLESLRENITAKTEAANLFAIILDILENNTAYTTTNNFPIDIDLGYKNAVNLIDSNIAYIQEEVTNYVTTNYPGLLTSAQLSLCSRDVGYITDAIKFDLTYGGNLETIVAAEAYYVGAVLQIGSNEVAPTSNSFIHMASVVSQVILGTSVPTQNNIGYTTGTVGSSAAATEASTLINEIVNYINNPVAITPVEPNTISTGFYTLQNNKISFAEQVVVYIDNLIATSNTTFTYDREKCMRDVGFIIDAVSYDAVYGSNFKSINAGRAYLRGTSAQVIAAEKTQTLAAIEYLKTIALNSISNYPNAQTKVSANFDIILSAITNGSVSATVSNPYPANIDIGYEDAVIQINNNRSFIAAEVTNYVTVNYPGLLTANQLSTCSRDVGYILDAITYDLTYGGNLETIIAADAYYVGTNLQIASNELTATINSYNFMSTLVKDVVLNTVTPSQNTVTFTSGTAGSSAASNTAYDLITSISNYIRTQTDIPVVQTGNLLPEFYNIVNNIPTFQTAVTDYVDQQFAIGTAFNYDEAKCARDVGYILDAVGYDFMFGSNFRTISAARAYLRGNANTVLTTEKSPTIGALTYLNTLIDTKISSPTDIASANTSINLIVSTIQNAGLPANTVITNPFPTGRDTNYQTAVTQISNNRSYIEAEVTHYVTTTYPGLLTSAQLATCSRDVGYIIDAIEYDLTYGGNLETIVAADAYYVGTTLQIGSNELAATYSSYLFMAGVIKNVIQNTDAHTQNTVPFTSGTAASLTAATDGQNLVLDIANYVNTKTAITPSYPSTSWVANTSVADFNILEADKIALGVDVVDYVNQTYVYTANNDWAYSYDQNKCARDVGYIIDAISYDLLFGSNFASVTAGKAYLRGTAYTVEGKEKQATIDALNYLLTITANTIDNSTLDPIYKKYAVESITNNMTTIIDIINYGANSVPAISNPYPTNIRTGYENAIVNINNNRSYITNEVVYFINGNYPTLTYNQATCERDIGFVLDALTYDLTYGGNYQTSIAAQAYYVGTNLQIGSAELAATVAAYNFMANTVNKVILGTVTANTSLYVAGNVGSTDSANTVTARMSEFVGYVNNRTPITSILPNKNWVPLYAVQTQDYLETNKALLATDVVYFTNQNYSFPYQYNANTCARDIGFIIDAISYDVLYGGNQQAIIAADAYYSSGISVIPEAQRQPTIDTYLYLSAIVSKSVVNTLAVDAYTGAPYQNTVTQNTSLPAASNTEVATITDLFTIMIDIIKDGYTSIVTSEEQVVNIPDNDDVTFHQYSLITASGQTFEWVGSGININTALPSLGGVPYQPNNAVSLNGGNVYYTGTDQKGDFYIGNDLKINRALGTIEGRVFRRSLYSILTPYILALGQG